MHSDLNFQVVLSWMNLYQTLALSLSLQEGYLVYECNYSCGCSRSCQNRVLQNGVQIKLEVFKTEKKVSLFSSLFFCVCVCVVIMSPVSTSSHVVPRVGQSGPEKQSQEAHLFASMSGRL